MAVVKGSKQRNVRVEEYNPWSKVFLIILVFGLCLAVFASSFYYGQQLGSRSGDDAEREVERLTAALYDAEQRVNQLQQNNANALKGAEVDRASINAVREQVVELQATMAALEEENAFYRGLMAPSKNKKGLTIGNVELQKSSGAKAYRYKIVMQQLANSHQLLSGQMQIRVTGKLAGQELVYDIHELDKKHKSKFIKLRFKYFQTVTGSLVFPEGFEPEGLEIIAKSTGKNAKSVKKKFEWLVEEV